MHYTTNVVAFQNLSRFANHHIWLCTINPIYEQLVVHAMCYMNMTNAYDLCAMRENLAETREYWTRHN